MNHGKLFLAAAIMSSTLLAGAAFASDPQAKAHASAPTAAGAGHPSPSGHVASSSQGGHGAHWGYAGDGGPAHWGDLKEEYATCKTGALQSPIDMASAKEGSVDKISFNYQTAPLQLVNNGHTVQANMPPGSIMTVGGKTYELLQFHFHTPSEHVVLGKHYPMEMHLVHKGADGTLAVVGVFIEPGKGNDTLRRIWNHLPTKAGDTVDIAAVTFNPADMLPAARSYARYIGSLTTPPCSEGVRWHVMMTPVQVEDWQIKTASGIMGQNARPPQTIGNRDVVRD